MEEMTLLPSSSTFGHASYFAVTHCRCHGSEVASSSAAQVRVGQGGRCCTRLVRHIVATRGGHGRRAVTMRGAHRGQFIAPRGGRGGRHCHCHFSRRQEPLGEPIVWVGWVVGEGNG